MAKDYAKKSSKTKSASRGNSTKKRAAPPRNNDSSSLMIGGFIIIAIIAGLFFMKEQHIQKLRHKMLTAKLHDQTVAMNKPPEPQYDFYTILPKEKVWVPKSDVKKPNAATTLPAIPVPSFAPSTASVPNKTSAIPVPTFAPVTAAKKAAAIPSSAAASNKSTRVYNVQVAAFPQYAPANNLQAKLILEGYNVHIDPKPVNGWTRVWLGPFKTLQDAQNTLMNIAHSDHIKGIINMEPMA